MKAYIIFPKIKDAALARWLSELEHCAVLQKVGGSILGQGTYVGCGFDLPSGHAGEATNRWFSLT